MADQREQHQLIGVLLDQIIQAKGELNAKMEQLGEMKSQLEGERRKKRRREAELGTAKREQYMAKVEF